MGIRQKRVTNGYPENEPEKDYYERIAKLIKETVDKKLRESKVEVKGTLLMNRNGQFLLSWYTNGVAYLISATYPEEEILRVARSLAEPGT